MYFYTAIVKTGSQRVKMWSKTHWHPLGCQKEQNGSILGSIPQILGSKMHIFEVKVTPQKSVHGSSWPKDHPIKLGWPLLNWVKKFYSIIYKKFHHNHNLHSMIYTQLRKKKKHQVASLSGAERSDGFWLVDFCGYASQWSTRKKWRPPKAKKASGQRSN